MVTSLGRWLRHLAAGPWTRQRTFPAPVLAAIENAVQACESRHPGEIRFAIDVALPAAALWRGVTPREAAIEAFSRLRVWDTAHNNGVLIYVLLADRDVEIVADRGVARGKVPQEEWEGCCRVMEAHFARGAFRDGAVAGIEAVADVLRRHPPDGPDAGNELPNAPAVL
ncbi:MAG TPA: TPM domain-containing protein [Nevskiaceae bacterium]|nr:TPM domain-containing protein [Nevskiaceae bacterium]